MKKVNELILCRDKYESQEEFENEIKKAIMVLLNADNIITVRYDEKGLGIKQLVPVLREEFKNKHIEMLGTPKATLTTKQP